MVDTKISALTELTTMDDLNDVIAVVDVSATETKKLTLSTLRAYDTVTITATDASYAPVSSHELIVLDDDGDDTDIDVTMAAALTTGHELIVFAEDGGATGHTFVLGGSQTYDGTNQTCTLNVAGEFIHILAVSATRVIVLASDGVTYSA